MLVSNAKYNCDICEKETELVEIIPVKIFWLYGGYNQNDFHVCVECVGRAYPRHSNKIVKWFKSFWRPKC